jgi:ATP-dependent helicase/nuclease subunit A
LLRTRSIVICPSQAGPGAGKTFVLVERYLEILRAKKVSVDNIVAITFTNRAANEMRQRVRDRIDGTAPHVA